MKALKTPLPDLNAHLAKKAILIKGISDKICEKRPKIKNYDRFVYSEVKKLLQNR